MNPKWRVTAQADLRGRNTFGVEARAPVLVEIHDTRALGDVLALPELQGALPLVLGGAAVGGICQFSCVS